MVEHMFDNPVAAPFGFEGDLVRGVNWAGCRFDALVRPDFAEVDRRRSAGLGAVVDYGLMEALAALPLGCAINRSALHRDTSDRLQSAPPGIVEFDGDSITNVLEAPCQLVALVKRVPHWREVGTFSVFASQVPCLLVVPHHPRDADVAAERLGRAGLGLVSATAKGTTAIAEPRSQFRLGLSRRCLLERVFGYWLSQNTGTPANLNQALSCFEGGNSSC